MSLASVRLGLPPDLPHGRTPVLTRIDRDTWHLVLVRMRANHLAETRHLAPDRRPVHAEALQALETSVEVPHDPEAKKVLDYLARQRLVHGIQEGCQRRVDRLVNEIGRASCRGKRVDLGG